MPGRSALKIITGRKAGEDHARSQCPLRGERAAWIRNADRCKLEKTILRHFVSRFFFLTYGAREKREGEKDEKNEIPCKSFTG